MSERLLRAEAISKRFVIPGSTLDVLRGLDIEVMRGEIFAVLGASGVGKSTLLHILGTLERPTGGRMEFESEDVFERSDADLAVFRNQAIGFVFQFHHLLPEFTALENVMMPGLVGRLPFPRVRARARGLLDAVGLTARESHKPQQLSGGEQQRVAVARSLMCEPKLVIADEPSGNLDPETAERLHQLVYTLAREGGQTWVIATHNESLARIADRRGRLVQGRLDIESAPDGVGESQNVEGSDKT